jgi:DNA-dependent protein kinase catalytic subunit
VNNIQRNVTNSTSYFTPTIGSFLRIFFELNVIDQPEKLIRTASSKSFNHHIGIALLEKQLESTSGVLTGKIYQYKLQQKKVS